MASPKDRLPRSKIADRGAQSTNRPPAVGKPAPPPVAEDGPTMLFDMAGVVQDAESLRPISLHVERGVHQGQSFQIPEGTLVIGRGSAANLRLEHDSISRRHATLTRRGNQFIVRDLGSQNGTYINRARISGDMELQVGDVLAIGQSVLKLNELEQKQPTRTSSPGEMDFEDEPWRPRKTPIFIGVTVAAVAIGLAVVWLFRSQVQPPRTNSVAHKNSVAQSKSNSRGPEGSRVATSESPDRLAPATANRSKPQVAESTVASADDSSQVKTERIDAPKFVGLSKDSTGPTPHPKASTRSPARQPGRVRPTNTASLARYKVGDVAGAMEAAKDEGNDDLRSKLSRFDATLTEARTRLTAGDNALALRNFILALKIDEGISNGIGVYAAQIRKHLGTLYAAEGNVQLEGDNARTAKQAFALALKYDPSNDKAKAGMHKLQSTPAKPQMKESAEDEDSAPAARPQNKVRRTPNHERAAAIDAAFGG